MRARREGVTEPTEAIFESCPAGCKENTDGPDLERFEDWVLPSSQLCVSAVERREEFRDDGLGGKTLFVNIASGDEGEGEAEENRAKAKEEDENETQGPGHVLLHHVAPKWRSK